MSGQDVVIIFALALLGVAALGGLANRLRDRRAEGTPPTIRSLPYHTLDERDGGRDDR